MFTFGPIPRIYPIAPSRIPLGAMVASTPKPVDLSGTAAEGMVLGMLSAMGCLDLESVVVVTIDGEPRSKARPRFTGNGKPYSDPKQKANQEYILSQFIPHFPKPLVGNVAVACVFYRSNRQPIDTDNIIKQVLDSGTGRCWVDDRQITAVAGVTHMDRVRPRIVVGIGPHESSLKRDDLQPIPCPTCQKIFTPKRHAPSQRGECQRFCSLACASRSRGEDLSAEANCRQCMKPFRRRQAGMVFCSNECRMGSLNAKITGVKVTCLVCGGKVSRREYRVCRKCWKKK